LSGGAMLETLAIGGVLVFVWIGFAVWWSA
jgi:hypothetical protein